MRQFTVPTAFTAIDKMSPALSKMERKMSSFSKRAGANIDRLDRKFRKIGDRARKFGRSSLMFGAALLAPLGLAANEAIKFEKSMSNVSTIVDTSTEDMQKMGDEVLALATRMPKPVNELTSSLYDIRSAGIDANDAMSTLEYSTKLATAGLSDTQEATNITTSALNAFKSEGLDAAQTTDILFKTVQYGKTTISDMASAFGASAPTIAEAGVKLRDFSAATSALTTTGMPAAQAQTRLAQAVSKLNKPTSDMEKLFTQLGVKSGKELISSSENLVDVFSKLDVAAEKNNINLAKAWGSSEAYGATLALLGDQSDSYNKTLDDMANGSNAVNEAFEKQNDTTAAQAQIAKNNISVMSIAIGNALLPVLSDLMKMVTPMVKSFSDWARENKGTMSTIVKIVAAVGGLSVVLGGVAMAVSVVSKVMTVARGVMMAWTVATKAVAVAQRVLNVAMKANPIGLMIAGVTALVGVVGYLASSYKDVSAEQQALNDVQKKAAENAVEEKTRVQSLFRQLRALNPETEAYKNKLAELNRMSPEIVQKYNLQEGALRDLESAEKDLIRQIEKRARVQAAQELLVEAQKQKIGLQTDEASTGEIIKGLISSTIFSAPDKVRENRQAALQENQQRIDALSGIVSQNEMEKLNPEDMRTQKTISENNTNNTQNLKLSFEGMPEWMKATLDGKINKGDSAIPVTSSTL